MSGGAGAVALHVHDALEVQPPPPVFEAEDIPATQTA